MPKKLPIHQWDNRQIPIPLPGQEIAYSMPEPPDNPLVRGEVVYPYGSPQQVGVVEKVLLEGRRVIVRWDRKRKPRVQERGAQGLLRLSDLIEDHRSKIATHEARRDKALHNHRENSDVEI